ncbi:non-ribosomal peptide synthetase [Azospirillum brasilense]|uniref:non-ribosomal peptide synthetase n=1 Tax=Azospirillum brasilense TaxID=192 RepID=UPI001EDAD795|nr:non-ribosomal peptide synthetase [Azospirillum brasilense]UKJ76239.1 AMP-binding protein [Azospirillum brasilense]
MPDLEQKFPYDLFLVASRRYGEATAVEAGQQTTSYAAMRDLAQGVARQLQNHGIHAGDRVVVEGEVTRDLVAATLGCLCAGVVFVLISPDLPLQRRKVMVEQARPKALLRIGQPETESGHAPGRVEVPILPIGFRPASSAGMDEDPVAGARLDPDAAAYVFFTSGTTGTPKGVLGRAGGLAQFLEWERDSFSVGPGDKVSLLTGLSFDVVLRDMLMPLISGATLCLPPTGMARDGRSVLGWLDASGVTLMHAVPSLARSWLGATDNVFINRRLTRTLFAGEPLTSALVADWRSRFPNTEVINLYGPTETTLAKFHYRVPARPLPGIQPVGSPLPLTEAIILGPDSRARQPRGESGQVAIRTRYPSLGYTNAPEEQAARFVEFDDGPVYLTGDLGFLDEEGLLHLQGRIDHQVKINGVRIEPDGVAAELQEHPAVRNAAVVARTSGHGEPVLVAYYVSDADTPHDPAANPMDDLARELRNHLSGRLPSAMVPGLFIRLASLPLTPNGKLDRRALDAVTPVAASVPTVEARDPLEASVLSAWRRVFGRADIGVEHDFFENGGNSLAAAEICARLSETLNRVVEPRLLLDHATPARLAAHLGHAPLRSLSSLPIADRRHRHRLSPQQRRYHATFVAHGNRSWCNMVADIPLPATASRLSVADALRTIVARHDSLQVSFAEADGELWQEYGPDRPVDVAEIDLSTLNPAARSSVLVALRVGEGERIIPIDVWPLFRATLVHTGPDGKRLLWNVHHMVSDGRSQGLLSDELRLLLGADGALLALPDLPRQYRDFSEWFMSPGGPAADDAHRAYWRSLHAAPYRRPCLSPHGNKAPRARAAALKLTLPDDLTASIRKAARDHRTTPFIILLSGYLQLCHRLCMADDLVVATPIAGRDHPDTVSLIGNFISLVTLRSRLTPESRFADLVAAMRRQVPEAAAHQAFQYDELMAELGLPIEADRFPLTGFSINYMPMPSVPVETRESALRDLGFELKYDLLLMVRDHSDAIALEFQHRSALFTPEEMTTLAGRYLAVLAAGVATPAALLDRTPDSELASVTSRISLAPTAPADPSLSAPPPIPAMPTLTGPP